MDENDNDGKLVIIDNDGVEVIRSPRRHRIPLKNAKDVTRELARLYRQMKVGLIPTTDGSKLAYVLNLLRQSIETSDIEARLQALEQSTTARKQNERKN